MAKGWLVLSTEWKLEDVQAGLNVIISVICVLAAWTTSRFYWQKGATTFLKTRNAKMPSLLTFSTLGEIIDIIQTFRRSLLSSHHSRILIQCVIIATFSIAALLSGPISSFSTRESSRIYTVNVDGFLTTTHHESITSAIVDWNQTLHKLDRASFPPDQLLDFLPAPNYDWRYNGGQWNSTWTAECEFVEPAPVPLTSFGDLNGLTLFDQIPGLLTIVPSWFNDTSTRRVHWVSSGFYDQQNRYKDLFLFIFGTRNNSIIAPTQINISVSCVHLHNSPRPTQETEATWAAGPIELAVYSQANCRLTYSRPATDELHRAFPWTNSTNQIVAAYGDYFHADLVKRSTSGQPIQPPSSRVLFQFYQAYHITKDIQYVHKISRPIDVSQRTVELSIVFLAIFILLTIIILALVIRYLLFCRRYHSGINPIPDSRLDWMLQSIKEASVYASNPDWQEGKPLGTYTHLRHDPIPRLEAAVYADEGIIIPS
ncbi:hypothetical protein MGYG_08504 [Nannizzia gypsea CBS 118893]|uniref:Uncharacterized protein n=1 Tax=Arthroderma gypseum (strain ATCC MYA-4604 / CBS 118893) TaxID=535722 RepID=E4V5W4_ARTGP|nr:hypothetical protein MGYG_08504 [Nannizzia gypsea CBS 118893]EFR05489.1 hypothetical protein MGYG_08504 [Nannizzia gypsea CBS 118893]